MPCRTCGRTPQWHGSQEPHARPGTYLSETGCHDGVRMDDDEYHEGWQPDVVYPPCPYSPLCCPSCGGDGRSRDPNHDSDDCAPCNGTGWTDAKPQWPASAEPEQELSMTEAQIKYMVDRFLGWHLPANFNPDAGIKFDPEFNKEYMAARGQPPMRHEPTGTNLFDATQAEAMVRYMIDGMPAVQNNP